MTYRTHAGWMAALTLVAGCQRTPTSPEVPTNRFRVEVDGSPQLGPSTALVTIVEFGSYRNPQTAETFSVIKQIMAHHEGDVRFNFRFFPLIVRRFDPPVESFAAAAWNKPEFWALHERLLAHQSELKKWSQLEEHARQVGLSPVRLRGSIEAGRSRRIVERDVEAASKMGVVAGPVYFVNGRPMFGALSFAQLDQAVVEAKAEAEALVARGVPRSEVYAELTKNYPTSPPPAPPPPPITRRFVPLAEGTPVLGAQDPLVTVVVFSDFNDNGLRLLPVLQQAVEDYEDDVQFRFRSLPANPDPSQDGTGMAAAAVLAAREQGRFWDMYGLLMKQRTALRRDVFMKDATDFELDVARFESDLGSETIAAHVARDVAAAASFGVRGTPTMFINGIPFEGARSYGRLARYIDTELEAARARVSAGVPRTQVYDDIMRYEVGKTWELAPARKSVPSSERSASGGRPSER